MQQYHAMLERVLKNGRVKSDRTGTGTISVFGYQMRLDLAKGFPLVTTKKIFTKAMIHELLWFLKGSTNNEDLNAVGVTIWDEWVRGKATYKDVELTREEQIQAYARWRTISREEAETELEQADREFNAVAGEAKCELYTSGYKSGTERIFAICHEAYEKGRASMPLLMTKRVIDKPAGDLGPIYGKQWRSWEGPNGVAYDQIQMAIDQLKSNPDSRRNLVSAWNVADLTEMALMPCHTMFQFYADELTLAERVDMYVKTRFPKGIDEELRPADHLLSFNAKYLAEKNDVTRQEILEMMNVIFEARKTPTHRLSCQLYQRSADAFLGVPFNIASYALLTHMVAQVTNMAVGDFIHTFGGLHIYSNHIDQVQLQLSRKPKPLSTILLNPVIKNIDDFTYDDVVILGYDPHPAIKAPVAV